MNQKIPPLHHKSTTHAVEKAALSVHAEKGLSLTIVFAGQVKIENRVQEELSW